MMKIFKPIQDIFNDIFDVILSNKYVKALFLTSLLIMFVGTIPVIIILAVKIPIIGAIVMFIIIYLMILTDLG